MLALNGAEGPLAHLLVPPFNQLHQMTLSSAAFEAHSVAGVCYGSTFEPEYQQMNGQRWVSWRPLTIFGKWLICWSRRSILSMSSCKWKSNARINWKDWRFCYRMIMTETMRQEKATYFLLRLLLLWFGLLVPRDHTWWIPSYLAKQPSYGGKTHRHVSSQGHDSYAANYHNL